MLLHHVDFGFQGLFVLQPDLHGSIARLKLYIVLSNAVVPGRSRLIFIHVIISSLNPDCTARHRTVLCSRPDSCIQRNCVDDFLRRNLLRHPLNSFGHIAKGSYGTGNLRTAPVLVITHDNHIVCHHALLRPFIMCVIVVGHIVIDGKHKPLLSARYGQLPDKLDIILASVLGHLFKIHIDSIKAAAICLTHQNLDNRSPLTRIR